MLVHHAERSALRLRPPQGLRHRRPSGRRRAATAIRRCIAARSGRRRLFDTIVTNEEPRTSPALSLPQDVSVAIDRDATLKQAEKLLRQGKLDGAIEEYVRLVDDQPQDWNSINALGDLYVRAGKQRRRGRAVHSSRRPPVRRGLLRQGGRPLQEGAQGQTGSRAHAAAAGRDRRAPGEVRRREAVPAADRQAAPGAGRAARGGRVHPASWIAAPNRTWNRRSPARVPRSRLAMGSAPSSC